MRLPDFICVGAQKSGTTWLYEQLSKHPQVFMPAKKELNFFYTSDDLAWYKRQFQRATASQRCGDISPNYSAFIYASSRIHATCPNALILHLLRDPVDRAHSQWRMARYLGSIPREMSFIEAFRRNLYGMRRRGKYALILKEYARFYPLDQTQKVFWYDDIRDRPAVFLASVMDFIGVDSDWRSPHLDEVAWPSPEPGVIEAHDAVEVRRFYEPFDDKLRALLDVERLPWDKSSPAEGTKPRIKSTAAHPYENLPSKAFWRTAVAEQNVFAISGLWDPKHRIDPKHKVAAFGSDFALRFGRALRARGYTWHDTEASPSVSSNDVEGIREYGKSSDRPGDISTAAALKQWVSWALGTSAPPPEAWESDGRYYDPFRPAVQPGGFASLEEMLESRKCSIQAFRDVITSSDRFVFTMGSTEGWVNWFEGYDYAICPGTIAGTFDPAKHEFKNYSFEEILSDMQLAISEMHKANRNLRFLITVSPAPLTATGSGEHVLTATTYSQSVLRAVAGAIAARQPTVDYFPSYEIIASPPFRGMFYEPDQRTIAQAGLDLVMDSFFACLRTKFEARPPASPAMKQKRQAAQKRAETEVVEIDEVPSREAVGHALESDAPLGLESTNPVDETGERAVRASTDAGPGDNDGRGHFATLDG